MTVTMGPIAGRFGAGNPAISSIDTGSETGGFASPPRGGFALNASSKDLKSSASKLSASINVYPNRDDRYLLLRQAGVT
jgi:hypothetical protein